MRKPRTKFQRFGGPLIVVVLALSVGAASLRPWLQRRDLTEARQAEEDTWCDLGDARLDRRAPVPHRCTTVDMTMRSEPLGDDGVKLLVDALLGKRWAKPERRRVRRLLLQHQDISGGGARRLMQALATCADGRRPCAFDVKKRFEVDLTNNPIDPRGVEQIRASVERARSRGFRVIVWCGGAVEAKKRGGPLLRLGALQLQLGKPPPPLRVSAHEIRFPPTLYQRLLPADSMTGLRLRAAIASIGFICGFVASHLEMPVTVAWNEKARIVRRVRGTMGPGGGGPRRHTSVLDLREPS